MSRRRFICAPALAIAALALSAATASADGGPHVLTANSGTAGLAGDCAACHRAHTAQAADLLKATMPGLCLTCHDGTGATTDVVDGLQFRPDGSGDPTATVLGALRGGGFSFALIDSSHAARLITGPFITTGYHGHVGVLTSTAKQAVTSTHGGTGTVWGNGPDGTAGAGAGPVTMTCASCHNPHGNGQYRILSATPGADWTSLGTPSWFAPSSVPVTDVANPTNATRNYTILPGNLAADVVTAGYTATQGDYWRKSIGWTTSSAPDLMQRGQAQTNHQMTDWCLSCHTRYVGRINDNGPSDVAPTGDQVFMYRHLTDNYGCEQCHVSHGSNALMTTYSGQFMTNPDGSVPAPIPSAGPAGATVTSGDSRLLKVDNRGTCQLCHDPTGTAPNGYVGPIPSPGTP